MGHVLSTLRTIQNGLYYTVEGKIGEGYLQKIAEDLASRPKGTLTDPVKVLSEDPIRSVQFGSKDAWSEAHTHHDP